MGGWFHFVCLESIALADEAEKDDSPPRARWPWTATTAGPYREAYIRLNPRDARDELGQSYSLILDRYKRDGDDQGLADFFAKSSVRYARLRVDLGIPLSLSLDSYRDTALEMIADERKGRTAIQATLVDYVTRLFRFLYGPASLAQSPVKGPAPQSFLRCVFAMENEWAARATDGSVGESNPRAALNRATSRKVSQVLNELKTLYSDLFASIAGLDRRGELFAEAVLRYRSMAISSERDTEMMGESQLREFGRSSATETLADELGIRVDAIWDALTPYLRT